MQSTVASAEAYRLLHEGSDTLARVESNGIRIDTKYLKGVLSSTAQEIKEIENRLKKTEVFSEWKSLFRGKTNIGARDQLARVLYGDAPYDPEERDRRKKPTYQGMGFQVKELTKTGKPKTDAEAFSHITHPFVEEYVKLEKLKKVRGTFLTGIQNETVKGLLHPVYNLHLIISYRSSSDTPNFQNFPARDPWMSGLVRRCFISRKNHRLVEVDYGGIEVKIAACYNKDPTLINYILDPSSDMHWDTAKELFHCEDSDVDKPTKKAARHIAKNMFVFPQFYGSYFAQCALNIWAEMERRDIKIQGERARDWLKRFGVTKGLGTSSSLYDKPGDSRSGRVTSDQGTYIDDVRKVEDSFWKVRFRKYTQWKKRHIQEYQSTGQFKTLTGFVLSGILEKNDTINYPIQGSAFHCLLWALIRINRYLRKHKFKTKIVGQIHDSIVADVYEPELQDYLYIVKKIMVEEIARHWKWIIVPLEIEAEASPSGGTWFDKQVMEIP